MVCSSISLAGDKGSYLPVNAPIQPQGNELPALKRMDVTRFLYLKFLYHVANPLILIIQAMIKPPGESLEQSLTDLCFNWLGHYLALYFKHKTTPAEDRQGLDIFCALFFNRSSLLHIFTFLKYKQYLHKYTQVSIDIMCMCSFVEENISSLFILFSQK